MTKFIILEDEEEQANRLTGFLRDFAAEHNMPAFDIERYDRGVQLLDRYRYRCDADVVFLDIRLPDLSGMEVARRIRQMDSRVVLLFVTSLSQYAIEGYSVGALDYILKPVAYPPFAAKLERALRLISYEGLGTPLVLKTKEGHIRLNASEVMYLEVNNHDIYIHTRDGAVLKQWGPLSKFEEQLGGDHFVRCNSCYLVNLKYVQGVIGDAAVVADQTLAVSKPRRKEFLQALAKYRGGSRP